MNEYGTGKEYVKVENYWLREIRKDKEHLAMIFNDGKRNRLVSFKKVHRADRARYVFPAECVL